MKMLSRFDIVNPAFKFGETLPFVVVQQGATEAFTSFLTKFFLTKHLETLLTLHRPKMFCQLGHCVGLKCPSLNLNAPVGPSYSPKRIMLQFQICYYIDLNIS